MVFIDCFLNSCREEEQVRMALAQSMNTQANPGYVAGLAGVSDQDYDLNRVLLESM